MKSKLKGLIYITISMVLSFNSIIAKGSVFQRTPKIQIAILLDTSNSMRGLIDQTRNQLWQIVNEFSKAKKNGVNPILEVAIYEYGNSRLSTGSGYTRKVAGLTSELDEVSEALFSLTTRGGSEYCGYAIKTAVKELSWSRSDDDIKAIFIAGNEPFTQGPVYFGEAIAFAKNRNIVVNTIHAGNIHQGVSSGWKDAALLAGGEYISIDHNYRVTHYSAPQDEEIFRLNKQLNDTYIPYGTRGEEKYKRQMLQDKTSSKISAGLMSKRAQAKASSMYDNSKWDLVDAVTTGKVNVNNLAESEFPENLRKMSKDNRANYIEEKVQARIKIKEKMLKLTSEREKFVSKKRKDEGVSTVATMNEAVTSAIQKQGQSKNYTFGK